MALSLENTVSKFVKIGDNLLLEVELRILRVGSSPWFTNGYLQEVLTLLVSPTLDHIQQKPTKPGKSGKNPPKSKQQILNGSSVCLMYWYQPRYSPACVLLYKRSNSEKPGSRSRSVSLYKDMFCAYVGPMSDNSESRIPQTSSYFNNVQSDTSRQTTILSHVVKKTEKINKQTRKRKMPSDKSDDKTAATRQTDVASPKSGINGRTTISLPKHSSDSTAQVIDLSNCDTEPESHTKFSESSTTSDTKTTSDSDNISRMTRNSTGAKKFKFSSKNSQLKIPSNQRQILDYDDTATAKSKTSSVRKSDNGKTLESTDRKQDRVSSKNGKRVSKMAQWLAASQQAPTESNADEDKEDNDPILETLERESHDIDNVSEVTDLTKEQIKFLVKLNKSYLRNIYTGKVHNQRHEDYKSGGRKRADLTWQIPLRLYTDEQHDLIMDTIMSSFDSRNFKCLDYVMRVLMPEMLIKLYMDVHHTTYEEAEKGLQ